MVSIPGRNPDDRSGDPRGGVLQAARDHLARTVRGVEKIAKTVRAATRENVTSSARGAEKVWQGIKGGFKPKPPTKPAGGGTVPGGGKPLTGENPAGGGGGAVPGGGKPPSGEKPAAASGGGPPEDPSRGGTGGTQNQGTAGGASTAGSKSGAVRNFEIRPFRGFGGASYRLPSRVEVKALKKELRDAAEAFKQSSKCFKTNAEQMKSERERLKRLIDEYAEIVKAGLDNQAAMLNITRDNADLLKILVEELKLAVKSSNAGKKRLSMSNVQEFVRSTGLKACKDLTFLAATVGLMLVAVGYIELSDPAPFDPRNTMAGKLLFDDFTFGLNLRCTSSFTPSDSITSTLSGELNDLQRQEVLKHIEEKWSCQIGVSPGNDVVLKGAMRDIWIEGLKVDCDIPLYDGLNRKMEFNKKFRFGSLEGKLGLNESPVLSLTAMCGTKIISGGVLADYGLVPPFLRRLGVGGSFSMFGLSTTLMMEKLFNAQAAGQQPPDRDQVTSTLHWQASEATAVGAMLTRRLDTNETSFTVGVEHKVDSTSAVKCRLTNQFLLTAMMQHKLSEKAVVSLTGEVDLRALNADPRIGLSFSFAA